MNKLPKFIKDMLPSLAGVVVGLLILLFVQGKPLFGWIGDEPDAIQKADYQSYFLDVKKETKVIMFGTKWCQYCAKAREYFTANNIAYIDNDVEGSNDAMKVFKELQGNSYPLVLLRGVKIVGFNKDAYDDLLKIKES
jgi:mycoredoxin